MEADARAHGFTRWLAACLADERAACSTSREEVAALRPELRDTRDHARATAETAALQLGELRLELRERELALEAEIARLDHELKLERARADAQLVRYRDEAEEVCKAAAEEASKLRESAAGARARHERNQRALLHWCGGHLLNSFLRHQALAVAAHVWRVWVRLAKELPHDDLWRSVGD